MRAVGTGGMRESGTGEGDRHGQALVDNARQDGAFKA